MTCPMVLLAVALVLVVSTSTADKENYDGYKLLSFQVKTTDDVAKLLSLGHVFPKLDFWTHPIPGRMCTVLVYPSEVNDVMSHLDHVSIEWTITPDVQRLVDASEAPAVQHKEFRNMNNEGVEYLLGSGGNLSLDHDRYHSYEEIMSGVQSLKDRYPDNVNISHLNYLTHEGRHVTLVQISGSKTTGPAKKAIIIEAGMHAREWITTASTLFVLEKLLVHYSSGDETARFMLDKFDWFIIPNGNPDGYEYTRSTFRFWRKNMRRIRSNCTGVDLNRNFDYRFGTTGVSFDCASYIYPGQWGFSEPETANVRDLVFSLKDRLVGYLSVHSYSQFLMTPWAYIAGNERPDHSPELDRVGHLMLASLNERHNKTYIYGTPYQILEYAASGSVIDYVLSVLPTIYTYAYELRPDPFTPSGFLLHPDEIVPTGEELLSSLATFAKEIQV